MQAIITKYVGPTTHRGARVIAKCDAGKVFWSWDHALGVEENHDAAALMLMNKLGWQGPVNSGSLPRSMGGYVFVFANGSYAYRAGMKKTVAK
jgi:hypothetical protein